MFFMSGSQAQAFAAAAQTMTERVRRLGPNPLRKAEIRNQKAESNGNEDVGFRGRK